MKKGTKKSGTRKLFTPGCGCPDCDRKAEPESWYCWKHSTTDLGGDTDPYPGLKSLAAMMNEA